MSKRDDAARQRERVRVIVPWLNVITVCTCRSRPVVYNAFLAACLNFAVSNATTT
jgi:hypothetical protein